MTETTTIFTMVQFGIIGLFAAIVIFGILFGMRMKRRRIRAEKEVDAHREAALDTDDAPVAPPRMAPEPATAYAPGDVAPEPAVAAPAPAEPVAELVAPAASQAVDRPMDQIASAPAPSQAPLAGDITQLKGLGPKLAATLAELGITRVDQIAAMTPEQLADLDARLGPFSGRPARDRWAEQAALLVAGDRAAYEAEFGKLG